MAVIGSIVNVGDSVDATYSGIVESFVIPKTGVYMLEVWGGGSRAGYSKGYKKLNVGTTLYIACGGACNKADQASFNGGGISGSNVTYAGAYDFYSGGGATHIALVDGTLSEIGKETFDESGLIVAGGAGGSYYRNNPYSSYPGNYGGGLEGGVCIIKSLDRPVADKIATQITGYAFGRGGDCELRDNRRFGAGGGGGYFGGFASGSTSSGDHTAGGGSGYIGGVPAFTFKDVTYSPQTTADVVRGNVAGTAKITFVAAGGVSVKLGNIDCSAVKLGNIDMSSIKLGSIDIG